MVSLRFGRIGLTAVGLFLLLAGSFPKSSRRADAQETTQAAPEAEAQRLLRGAESARLNIKSGHIVWNVTIQTYGNESRTESMTLDAVFEGDKRKYIQYQDIVLVRPDGAAPSKAAAVHSAFDGANFLQYAENIGAYVRDQKKGTAELVFDPRILGTTVFYNIGATIENCLPYRGAKNCKVVGEDKIDGVPTRHVECIDPSGSSHQYWIDDRNGFRVLKYDFQGQNQHRSTASYYDEKKNKQLPWKAVTFVFDRQRQIAREIRFEQQSSDFGMTLDVNTWTWAGLGVPKGSTIIDDRIQKVTGFWDGTKVTARLLAAQERMPNLQALLTERLEALHEASRLAGLRFKNGEGFEDIREVNRMLLEAELELCDADKDRVSVLKKHLVQAKEYESMAEQLAKIGQGRTGVALMFKADCLQIEIALEKAKSKMATQPK